MCHTARVKVFAFVPFWRMAWLVTVWQRDHHSLPEGGTSMQPTIALSYRSLHLRAYVATGFLVLLGIAAIVTIASAKAEIDLLQRAVAGASITEAEALANDTRQQRVNMLFLGLHAATAVAFIAWMYGASQNLAPLNGYDRRYQKYAPVHTIFWWFVPVAHLWQPYRVMKNIWNDTHGLAEDASSKLLMLWWLFWLVSNAVGWVGWWEMFNPAASLEAVINTDYRTIASHACLLVAGILVVTIVLQVTRAQDRRNQRG